MWQAEIRVDLGAIRHNVTRLRSGTSAEVMAVVKADGYGHGMVPVARAALEAGATWLGAATVEEALALRAAGIEAPVLAWLIAPGTPLGDAVRAGVTLSVGSQEALAEALAAARTVGRPVRVHLKVDTGLNRGGAKPADWTALVEAAARAQEDGRLEVDGVWSHLACADLVDHPSIDAQLAEYHDALAVAARAGITPRYRHLANSAATLTRPDCHFDLVRAGIAVYGLSPVPGETFGLRPAMTVRARVIVAKRVPGGEGVSYGHTYTTKAQTTLAVVPLGYGDGVPRHASNSGPVLLGGRRRTVAGRVCMDQIVLDCGDDPVRAGDVAVLFGPGDQGEPTADDWADAVGTINYEIVTRMGGVRIPRVYDGEGAE
ncbi:alanine racemase [Rugosimonospora acidiphila]|uniref:Alanine racemase n=1 Tax=Rugosimonospora acidiphila TaxID=556531 RepID=A0ABP9RJU2_9ACTN